MENIHEKLTAEKYISISIPIKRFKIRSFEENIKL